MKMYTAIVTILGVPVLCTGQFLVADVCDTAPDTDGCSIPGNLPYFYDEVFMSDCNKHDVCYSCGQSRGVSRLSCDKRFYENIKRTCRTDDRVRRKLWCRAVTLDYYLAARAGGSSHYKTMSLGWCDQSLVPQCLRGDFYRNSPFALFANKITDVVKKSFLKTDNIGIIQTTK